MQVEWLVAQLQKIIKSGDGGKRTLTRQELTPYLRLLLAVADENDSIQSFSYEENFSVDGITLLKHLLQDVDPEILELMVECTDVYDLPKLFKVLPDPTVRQAVIALRKAPPPYEKKPHLLFDNIYHSINGRQEGLLENAAEVLRSEGEVPPHFDAAFERFQEIMMDEKILSDLYPKAK